MYKYLIKLRVSILVLYLFIACVGTASGQSELMPWGNLSGIRIQGQLMEFTTSLNVVGKNWSDIQYTAKEAQKPKFKREDNIHIVNTALSGFQFTETTEDVGIGSVKVVVKCEAMQDATIKGIYFGVRLPAKTYVENTMALKNAVQSVQDLNEKGFKNYNAGNITFTSGRQKFSIGTDAPAPILQSEADHKDYIQLYLPVKSGDFRKGDVFEKTFTIQVSGKVDEAPVHIQVNSMEKGSPFAGFGGNFRLQNSNADPQVIDYCLENLRVAWGRVEMPWRNWHPDQDADPTSAADNGKLDDHVKKSMEMAERLGKMNIPVVLSAWFPPAWAVEGKLQNGPTPEGIWGNPLKKGSMTAIYKSITDYILYLKTHYNVEVKYFSFNESDIGINIRQTGEEHAALIKGLGAYFVSKGLKTKMLLGDNSDANSYKFIYPAMNDPEAKPYIGAVSFHSWRGWETQTLQKWRDAAKRLNVPLLVGEGSIDAAAWQYPAYFEEASYALEEINLYTRLLAICQPLSILQWQLTADYSPLKGGGIFGDNGPLEPTQRFWQLKQLASTPHDLLNLRVAVDRQDISCAAFGNVKDNACTLHIVNNSAGRMVYLKGIPSGIKEFEIFLTDKTRHMQKQKRIIIKRGEAEFKLDPRCYITMISIDK